MPETSSVVAWSDLIVPILLSAVLIFVASSLIHAVLKLHNGEFRKLSNEEEVRAVLRKGGVSQGMYITPHCHEGKMTPEFMKKFEEGPNTVIYVRPTKVNMGVFLGKWFAYTVVVSLIAGYVARAVLHPGASYLQVFQVVGVTSWLAYAWQGPSDSIWAGKPWRSTIGAMLDGLLYACLTAGAFGWRWPHA
ncbi:MAG TPA: hypothetical protein VM509_01565 [Planctomycetota bacterium]|nr:hypothetical protein [Planctomycetota bacterium]